MSPWLCLAIAYLAGSIPSAYIAGKLNGVDLREHGSGNLGATNVVRVLGTKTGALVFAVDVLKGFLPVYFLPRYADTLMPAMWALAFGVAAIVGHVKPVFLLWRGGGKGVATAAGVFAALAPLASLVTFGVWMLVFLFTKYVSLASLIGAVTLPTAILILSRDPESPVFISSVFIAAFVIWTHRANIGRLRRGEEHRFVKKAAA
ncbi:MAG: glycerol-3-phosphate 1-O-acyltransferase PlsY [Gemmatimonadaceae bacterium]|nr:glycerol-3-phosphate 1-O-acyltransferase PlsY [Gemmatimonadaceae bacterium]